MHRQTTGNTIDGGTYAVQCNAGTSGTVITNNILRNLSTGAFGLTLANHQVGPVVNGGGTIASTSPFANLYP